MSPAEAEKWIVDLILDSKLVAKIDSRENYVEMDTQSPSVYQQVGVLLMLVLFGGLGGAD